MRGSGTAHQTSPACGRAGLAHPPQHIAEPHVDKNSLNPEALVVESFDLGDSPSLYMGNALNCTGCDSGCGIFPEEPYG
jgi:hypothetical protein